MLKAILTVSQLLSVIRQDIMGFGGKVTHLVSTVLLTSDEQYMKTFFYPYLPTPPLGQDITQGQFLSEVLTGLNSEFSFS